MEYVRPPPPFSLFTPKVLHVPSIVGGGQQLRKMVARLNHERRLFHGVCASPSPLLVIDTTLLPQLGKMVARLNHKRRLFD